MDGEEDANIPNVYLEDYETTIPRVEPDRRVHWKGSGPCHNRKYEEKVQIDNLISDQGVHFASQRLDGKIIRKRWVDEVLASVILLVAQCANGV